MHLLHHFDFAQFSRRARWMLTGAWLLIALKCVWVWWAVDHWQLPFHPMWVVGPTLMFAALVTLLWVTHHEN